MTVTLLVIVGSYLVLGAVGWLVLAPVAPEVRARLLPAAPLFGVALLAGVSSTATRWLTVPQTLPLVGVLVAACVAVGVWRRTAPWRVDRSTGPLVLLCPLLTVPAALAVALPTIWAGDNRPVAGTVVVDQFYFASNATYLTDHPLLPGPYWNPADWVGSAPPSYGPVVDVISNRLRYGQSAVASALSFLLRQEPSDTVTPLSITWVVVMGGAAFVVAVLLGVRLRWALLAVPLVTSSLYVTTQALEGKNDGLLGVSLALLALGLSYAVTRSTAYWWPLTVSVAGLASVYAELVLVLVPAVALVALLGSRRQLLARLNVVAASWALGAVLTPWAWIWLAESARIGGRFSDGATPFEGRSGLDLLRSVMGAQPIGGRVVVVVFSVAAVVCAVAILAGLVLVGLRSPARGAAIGLVLVLGWLELSAYRSGAGNLQYRTAQLGWAFVLLLAVVGWQALLRLLEGRPRSGRAAAASVVAVAVAFASVNLATAASHLPRERAEVQHVDAAQLDEALGWVEEVDAADVAVLVPRFTDLVWLALGLREHAEVAYPVLPAIYLGSFPRWDREPDRYYLLGAGAETSGDVTVLEENERYRLVELGPTGSILTPFQPTYFWGRTTYMRGFPCARDFAQLLLVRGSTAPATFTLSSRAGRSVRANLDVDVDGRRLEPVGRPRTVDGWNVQSFRAPRFRSAIMTLTLTAEARRSGTSALPLVLDDAGRAGVLERVDPGLATFCLADDDADMMDGYDRNVTVLRGP
ncbi:hypothetical protein QWY28_07005 [Nocardioides sp. SOB77]|uniref:Uncharacterized protein n=1 Tax=Nocardioides oceani TaxID=3058369 RepID=A0ABT8FDB9_9ACTN|nr:hypothetical protein [Nocardioides oceani]MDN4172683.1 hypothetical protein [Nocardioides oceani]